MTSPIVVVSLTAIIATLFVYIFSRHEIAPLALQIDILTARLFHVFWELLGFDITVEKTRLTVFHGGEGKSIFIGYGCDGILAYLILSSAIVTTPCKITYKLKGLIFGLVFVVLMNQVRLIGLIGALLHLGDKLDFRFAHTVLGQIFAIVMIFVFWRIWISKVIEIESKKQEANSSTT